MNLKSLKFLLPLAVVPLWAYACETPQGPQVPPQSRSASTAVAAPPEHVVSAAPEPAGSVSAMPSVPDPNAEPEPPAPAEMTGSAAIVWAKDEKAAGGFRSVWIEPDGAGAKVVAERKEAVFVSSGGLYGIGKKTAKTLVCDECDLCAADPPKCKKNRQVELPELFLRGLGKQPALEPWKSAFASGKGCKDQVADHHVAAEVIGGVGPVVFAGVSTYNMACMAAHGVGNTEAVTFDLDTGFVVRITPHPEQLNSLKHKAHEDLNAAKCVIDEEEEPALYRITARYRPDGRLEAVYTFTMSAAHACGNGPASYTSASEQASLWLPQELVRYGKMPGWVASYLQKTRADTAFMVTSKVDEARAQFAKK